MCYRWHSCCRLLLSRTLVKLESLISIWMSDIKHINISALKKWLKYDRSLFFTHLKSKTIFWLMTDSSSVVVRGSWLFPSCNLSLKHGFQGDSAHLHHAGKERDWGPFLHDLEFSCSLFMGLGSRGSLGGHTAFSYRVYPSFSFIKYQLFPCQKYSKSFPRGDDAKFYSATVFNSKV